MIAVERIIEDPRHTRVELPIATDIEIREIMTEKIDDVVAHVKKSFRAKAHYGHELITLRSEDFSETTRLGDPSRDYRVERTHGQEVVMELMKGWGLDENRYTEKTGESYMFGEGDYEVRKYPSRLKGMEFQRIRVYHRDTGDTFEVRWVVVPTVATFKFNPLEALSKKK